MSKKHKEEVFATTDGAVTGRANVAPTAVEIAGDSKQRVDDGTKEGGIITQDLVEGKKEADRLNKAYGVPGY